MDILEEAANQEDLTHTEDKICLPLLNEGVKTIKARLRQLESLTTGNSGETILQPNKRLRTVSPARLTTPPPSFETEIDDEHLMTPAPTMLSKNPTRKSTTRTFRIAFPLSIIFRPLKGGPG